MRNGKFSQDIEQGEFFVSPREAAAGKPGQPQETTAASWCV
jgi:hypothetical protein